VTQATAPSEKENRQGSGPSLRRSVGLTAVAALVATSAILIAYAEIRGASLAHRHSETSISLQTDLINTMLDLRHERLAALARQLAVDPEVDSVLVANVASSEMDEALQIVREAQPERPTIFLVSSGGQAIASADNGSVSLGPNTFTRLRPQTPYTDLLIDEVGSPVQAHSTPVRRGNLVVGTIWTVLPVSEGIDEFFPKLSGLAYRGTDGEVRSLLGAVPETGVGNLAGGGDLRARSMVLSVGEGRRLEATIVPLQYGATEAAGDLILLRDISDALRREELLTMMALTAVLAIILLSLGLLLQKLRVGFRPLGAVVRLLGAMSGGETKMRISGIGPDRPGMDGKRGTASGAVVRSGREIDTLLLAVDSFRSSLDARNELIAVTEQLENARRIQQSLLPATFNLHPGLDIHGRMRPALEVAGDFFDIFTLDDGRVALLIADVSGKGMAPALFAAQASALLRAQCHQFDEPAKVMQAANNALCERNPEDMFITAILAIVTPDTGEVNFVNAGHCPPMIAKQDGTVSLVTTAPDMVIGVLADLEWAAHRVVLAPGEQMLLYSDGLDEAQKEDGTLLGTEGAVEMFRDACATHGRRSSRLLCERMLDRIDAFAAGARQADDISILVVHRKSEDEREVRAPTPDPE